MTTELAAAGDQGQEPVAVLDEVSLTTDGAARAANALRGYQSDWREYQQGR